MSIETAADLDQLSEDMAVVKLKNLDMVLEDRIQKEKEECCDANGSISSDSVASAVVQSEKLGKAAHKKNNHHVAKNLLLRCV